MEFLLVMAAIGIILLCFLLLLKDERDNIKKVEIELSKTSARYVIVLCALHRIMEDIKWNCYDAQELKHIVFQHIIKAMNDIDKVE